MNQELSLIVKDLRKDYHDISGAKQHVLQNVNFDVNLSQEKGCLISILAPFGAGKTTLLKIISGIEKPTSGSVILTGKKYENEQLLGNIVFIPEKASSFPWLNVKQNIIFAAKLKSKIFDNENIDNLIDLVGLSDYENHFPHHNSLGFRFRIALARSLVVNPHLLLLDDPLKNLHHLVKIEIRELINSLISRLKINIIIATTNINDSISVSDEILLMKKNPGMIIDKIKVDRLKLIENKGDYFTSLKQQIEKTFAGYDNSSLISEAKDFQL